VAAGVAVTVVVVAGQDSGSGRTVPPTRARSYGEQQACLLTGARGLAEPAAGAVWAGMRDASAGTGAKVSYLAVTGEQTVANATPYLATLAGRRCTVVLTVGAAPDGAARAAGPAHPGTRFLVVGPPTAASGTSAAPTGPAGPNVTTVPAGSAHATRAAVATAVTAALHS
jgi:hypothetical protein